MAIRSLTLIFFILILSIGRAEAQISFGGVPRPLPKATLRAGESTNCICIIPDSTTKKDDISPCAMAFADPIEVDIDVKEEATMYRISDETVQYRLLITSPNATSLNLIFSEFDINEGGKLYISTPDMGEMMGVYTKESISSGFCFATTPIEGDTILLIYEEPIEAKNHLKISRINRGFLSLKKLPNFAKSKECEKDAICEPNEYEMMRRATCLIIVNGTSYCTGSLINNTADDGTPYVLTSAHCLFDAYFRTDTTKARSCVFFFDYKSPLCGSGIEGTREKSMCGAKVVAYDNKRDALLLQLSQPVPADYMPYYAGWDATGNVSGQSVCFHHPAGDVMKASREEEEVTVCSYLVGTFNMDSHWKVERWEEGITEGGSSGSALYNHGMIIGGLSGGDTDINCETRGFDCFWRLYSAWDSLGTYLDKAEYEGRMCDGIEPYALPCRKIQNYASSSEIFEAYNDETGFIAGTNTLGITEIAEKFRLNRGKTSNSKTKIYGVSFVPVCAIYNENEPIVMSLLNSDMERIWSETVHIRNTEYIKKTDTFTEKEQKSLSYKENYVRFNEPIEADSVVYVSFDFSGCKQNKFALFSVAGDTTNTTAYYNDGMEWKEYSKHPHGGNMRGLMVSIITQNENDWSTEPKFSDGIAIYPNPAREYITVSLPNGERAREIKMYDGEGKLTKRVRGNNKVNVSGMSKGVYLLKVDGWGERKVIVGE